MSWSAESLQSLSTAADMGHVAISHPLWSVAEHEGSEWGERYQELPAVVPQ